MVVMSSSEAGERGKSCSLPQRPCTAGPWRRSRGCPSDGDDLWREVMVGTSSCFRTSSAM